MKESNDVIKLDSAVSYTAGWRRMAKERLDPEDYIKAFLIPMTDFTNILAEGAVSVRAYLGNNEETGEKKLLLVGVDADGNDMIDYDAGKYVFDFTTPCPAMCDKNSPLNSLPGKLS
jgi:hypothetical protein